MSWIHRVPMLLGSRADGGKSNPTRRIEYASEVVPSGRSAVTS